MGRGVQKAGSLEIILINIMVKYFQEWFHLRLVIGNKMRVPEFFSSGSWSCRRVVSYRAGLFGKWASGNWKLKNMVSIYVKRVTSQMNSHARGFRNLLK